MGFPKKVHALFSNRPRVVCKGIAAALDLPVSGRRDMTGTIAPMRGDEYCSGTSAVLASALLSNTDVQCPYRLPLCSATHDPECKQKNVCKMTLLESKNFVAQYNEHKRTSLAILVVTFPKRNQLEFTS